MPRSLALAESALAVPTLVTHADYCLFSYPFPAILSCGDRRKLGRAHHTCPGLVGALPGGCRAEPWLLLPWGSGGVGEPSCPAQRISGQRLLRRVGFPHSLQ